MKKVLFEITKIVVLYVIRNKLMEAFKAQGLHIKYKEEIEAWFIYLDQQKFGKKLEKQILKEIDRFMAEKKTIEELLEEVFKEPEWIIEIEKEFIEHVPKNYVFKSVLGYA